MAVTQRGFIDADCCLVRPQDDPSPLEWIFYFGFWVMAAIIFAVKLRRGTLIHAESRKQRLDRERAASMTPLLCEQCGKQTTPTESEATPSEVRSRSLRSRRSPLLQAKACLWDAY